MNLTVQQINTLSQLSNYEDRLNWVKQSVNYADIAPLFSVYSFIPDSIENTEMLAKWYEPYFDEHIAHREFKKPMFLEKINLAIRPLQSDSEKREYLEKKIKCFEDFYTEKKSEQAFYIGYFYDDGTKYIELFNVLQCSAHKDVFGFLKDFMDGRHTKKAISWLNERLELYPKAVIEQRNINKKGKTSPTLSHKQQIVLLDKLGFLNAPIFKEITLGEKAEILGNLLNRNIQETRELLTYLNDPKGTHEKFSNTLENKEVVCRLLEHNGLTFADKKK